MLMGKSTRKARSADSGPKAPEHPQSAKAPVKKTKPKEEKTRQPEDLLLENAALRMRLKEAEETISAIREGEVDALVVSGPKGDQVYALKGAEQPYRILVESMNEGALTLMESCTIISCNKAFAKIAGMPCGTLSGRSLRDFISRSALEEFNSFWKRANEGEAKTELELSFDGRTVPTFISARSRLIEEECLIFAVVTDISERKRAEAELANYHNHLEKLVDEKTRELQALNEGMAARNLELETLNSELDAFVYSVSHDLRAPLRIMEGFAKVMAEDYADKIDEEGMHLMSRIRGSAERMSQLIDDLLRLSRISRQEIHRTDSGLSEIAAAIIYGLRQADPARNVEVVVQEGVRANVDPDLMKIAISNLLSNAWKFTSKSEKARIEFGVTERHGKTTYFVKDNGSGFDPAAAGRMFLPFQRLHTEKEFEGTGIGLSIVERIIRRHGGKVWAEGEVGKGAALYFTLERW